MVINVGNYQPHLLIATIKEMLISGHYYCWFKNLQSIKLKSLSILQAIGIKPKNVGALFGILVMRMVHWDSSYESWPRCDTPNLHTSWSPIARCGRGFTG